ncbi:MAG: hypothetical protein A2445_02460 [Candidatus Jacksonbacteria bacterium RIFOXYC2_FULL_44_29]|nr:MAG: Transcriptional regulator, TrmB [Parcubacteria group bacterium GW2011_GWC2_44_22]OGY74482.1 MAG: hypothetical protein A2240_02720 [Candidatus Jacksonbacteria bacterium RIFOXYA2_FULL_43_12]OGY77390.1 MAG: hypothetical protein A2295_01670 [Candidatus Jacksonbacteria bacterium RIFOXYB2_FULL_44_15]OGY78162.1 MAG: hypothetical protein A2550_06015 [Candidatus Jacksonbacteria bacterium RIFOXYD2_FULL_43_21]OGY80738.1 MAG: hypothetical protein A2445_02460 [Candidatus Jacksonbacteria bacterium RI
MYEAVINQIGLTTEQAAIYEALVSGGPMKAAKISQKTSLKRGFVYFLLEQLVALGLVEKEVIKAKTAIFKPAHPYKLKELAEKREKEAKEAQIALDGVLPQLVSNFNLASGKPGVRFFEGREGLIKIYEELLDEKSPIDSIEDKGEMAEFIMDYSHKFIKKRRERGIFNRVVCPASNPINKTSPEELRETRTIPVKLYPLSMDIKIVNNKVSLITLRKESAVGILIDHPEIAENFKIIFKYLWDSLEKNPSKEIAGNQAAIASSSSASVTTP